MSIKHYQEEFPRRRFNSFPLQYLAVLALFGYSVYLVVGSVLDSVRQSQVLMQKQAEIEELQLKVQIAERFIAYQQTASYLEKQARQHFGYAKAGETVINLPDNSSSSQSVKAERKAISNQNIEQVRPPNWQKWWEYYFGRR